MTLQELRQLLDSVLGADKVAYIKFPVGKAPQLPFITFRETASANISADDNAGYVRRRAVDIELYTEHKDIAQEESLEDALVSGGIAWETADEYIDSERCHMRIYSTII